MKNLESSTAPSEPIAWETLEEFIRLQIQSTLQETLEAEIAEYLGRDRYERQGAARKGYRNGFGKPRKVSLSCGTVEVRRPRLRDLEERFESRVLPRFARQSSKVKSVLPELYLEGLALRDFDPRAARPAGRWRPPVAFDDRSAEASTGSRISRLGEPSRSTRRSSTCGPTVCT